MKQSLDHLPEQKQEELERVTSVICRMCDDVEMIVLFGSYARGDYKDEANLAPDRKSGHKSDYDILVVTKEKSTPLDTRLWREITKKCDGSDLSTHVRLIVHDIQFLNIQLAEGQYFFTDIKKEGYLLFDSGKLKLACKRKLKPEEQRRIVQDYFDHWFQRANHFYDDFAGNLKKERHNQAAFNLHQAAEASYKSILLVFTHYCPNEHYLCLLGEMAAQQDSSLIDIFPTNTREEHERFKLLDYAYIGARYDPEFRITEEDLRHLSVHVKSLLERTEEICTTRIRSLVPGP